ncbi:putative indoleamine 2,3-dioxygenase 2 [Apostichopus japonicus]|uniref:Putative indoleamine 2,3-dioxygenase 2 n=1 Tax=Stichopus japonicus TaxID=307972 RepID=A0A2G8LNA3_STIJA|nr:putative indoleamine 2,3-dioxygenase 2 [Apostichopus japonicus]
MQTVMKRDTLLSLAGPEMSIAVSFIHCAVGIDDSSHSFQSFHRFHKGVCIYVSIMTSFSDVESLKTRFDISEEFGFAAEYPLSELPEYFKPWTDIAHQLKQLIDEKKLRDEVHKLPLLDHNKLKSKAEWEAAHLFLAYISQGYVWQDGEEGIPEILPKCLAVPFHAASQHLQIPANYNQFNSVLVNWRLRDPQKPFQLEYEADVFSITLPPKIIIVLVGAVVITHLQSHRSILVP